MSCKSSAGMLKGEPASWSSQPSLPMYTFLSVPSHASREPPLGMDAMAIGSGAVSACEPYPVTAAPSFTLVTWTVGASQVPTTRVQLADPPEPPLPLEPLLPLEPPPDTLPAMPPPPDAWPAAPLPATVAPAAPPPALIGVPALPLMIPPAKPPVPPCETG